MLEANTEWKRIVFTDEKKWNLDGPDGYQIYWRDLRKSPEINMKRQSGGGSVTIWGGFCAAGKTPLVFLDGRRESVKYTRTLSTALLPSAGHRWRKVAIATRQRKHPYLVDHPLFLRREWCPSDHMTSALA
uniref:GK10162 putative n=1 Tax=Albugo laibachii Nc14 TaxID=890382 RepID=F0WP56_9STRA|nr:GK10162 putative [Albugo laibachii Nc14]|eukprot:CCA23100.1 GK10162 putative [Albugo laibachii Nc14]